jgi:molybdopterin-containing oxidoreductase family membrane subunit
MLAGGLMVLMLDLGRPERLIVAATNYNLTSVFAWNVFLYSGMTAIVAIYLWTLMERRMNPYAKAAGFAAFIFRLILTTGTGAIFAFLVARQAYGSALLPPLFIVMSFGWGLAVFVLVQAAMYAATGRTLPADIERRMRRLLGVFVAATLYFVFAHHVTNAYFAKQAGFERFILLDGGVYPMLFWLGYVALGSIAPLALIYSARSGARAGIVAAALVIVGAFCALYVFIIGGQAYPLELFPGADVTSTFFDGQVARYAPSLPELLLGLGGVAAALLITAVGARVLDFMPRDVASPAGD